jgi:hypothetical protein
METIYLCLISCIIGSFAWGIDDRLIALAPLSVLLWRRAVGRLPAFGVMLAYYSAASLGIVRGAPVFFGPSAAPYYGVSLWLASAVALAAPWGIFWTGRFQIFPYAVRLSLALASSAVPPLAVVGWTNPLLAAGLFFPGWGWWGFVFLIVLLAGISWLDARAGTSSAAGNFLVLPACVCVISAFIVSFPFSPPSVPEGWKGIDTSFGRLASGSSPVVEDWQRCIALSPLLENIALKSTSNIVVLPETIAGQWHSLNEAAWLPSVEKITRTGKTIALGAEIWDGAYYDNLMLFFQPDGRRLDAKQRIPVPFSMYRPWSGGGARAYWFDDGIVGIGGKKIVVLICYEQFLTWPFLLSMFYDDQADIVVGTANDWWCRATNLPHIQTQTIYMLCRLFGKPLVTATNL